MSYRVKIVAGPYRGLTGEVITRPHWPHYEARVDLDRACQFRADAECWEVGGTLHVGVEAPRVVCSVRVKASEIEEEEAAR